jgi:hypothetical protein
MLLIGAASSLIMPMVYCEGYRFGWLSVCRRWLNSFRSRTTELLGDNVALRRVLEAVLVGADELADGAPTAAAIFAQLAINSF